jgi:ribonucleoside-diphosphate reductase alpha chain
MVKNWLCLASPVLSNLGTERGMPISCFGIDTDDSIEGIALANSELMRLSSQGGGVGIGVSRIRGRGKTISGNGVSEGVVPWVKIYDSTILATNQGSVRRGAASVNLSINHPDIEEFLMIRRPKGDVNRQCLNMHQCVVIDDEFMNKVEERDPKALKLWGEILKTRLETGEPYIMFEDNVNNANPEAYKKNNLHVSMTNICSEISLYTDELHSFICCLSSLNLARWDEWNEYKFENGMTLPELTCWFLEGVLQEFIDRSKNVRFMENTYRSASKGRAIGIGVLGWHTFLQEKGLPFTGLQANAYTNIMFEFIEKEALKASRAQAELYGEPEWCKGTGLRHTHHLAIAPTVSNAHISGGVSPSIEPIPANVFNLKTAKGTFIKRNPTLERLLESKGYNIDSVWEQIAKDKGSVLGLPDYILTDEEKEIFLTFKEINPYEIVRQNGIRQKYVDQAISLNLTFDPSDSPKYISDVHKLAWKEGIKTLYYMRSESILRGDTISRDDSCIACEG